MAEEEALAAVGPVPPDVASEADATPPDERTAEVARICAVLEAADRGPLPAIAAGTPCCHRAHFIFQNQFP
jgi:hypothetical protein